MRLFGVAPEPRRRGERYRWDLGPLHAEAVPIGKGWAGYGFVSEHVVYSCPVQPLERTVAALELWLRLWLSSLAAALPVRIEER